MSDFSDSIAFSDLTLTSKLILLLGWLIKSTNAASSNAAAPKPKSFPLFSFIFIQKPPLYV